MSGYGFAGMALAGIVGLIGSYFLGGTVPFWDRFWMNWNFWFLFILTIGLGSMFIVALEYLFAAHWSVPIRRVPERLASLTLFVAPLAIVGLFSLPQIYPWAQPEAFDNPVIAGKAVWLNVPFFSARVIVCLALWALAYRILVGGSFKQDETKDPRITVRARRFAPIYMIIFTLTITIVAFDWISSLEPEWYSDIFGVYLFAGTFLAGLAATTLAVLYLMKRGRLPAVRFDHLYNLGGFLFAFTLFWSYIGFAQYMLIWYANLPEEVVWFKDRIEGPWLWVALALGLFHFFIPFFALITREAKGNPKRLRWVAALVLTAHGLDLYWMMFPNLGPRPVFGLCEISFVLLFGGLVLLWLRWFMGKGADMPVGDPFLKEGLEFRL